MAQKKELDINLLIYAGLAIGGYFAITNILKNLGFIKSDEQKAAEALVNQGRQKFIDEVQKKPDPKQASKGLPTKQEGMYAIIANQIYEYLKRSAIDDNKKAAFEILYVKVLNDADIAKLIKYFGLRQEFAFGVPMGQPKDLNQFVTSNLSKNQIEALNKTYERYKMKFRF
jgi:hypothetical protein